MKNTELALDLFDLLAIFSIYQRYSMRFSTINLLPLKIRVDAPNRKQMLEAIFNNVLHCFADYYNIKSIREDRIRTYFTFNLNCVKYQSFFLLCNYLYKNFIRQLLTYHCRFLQLSLQDTFKKNYTLCMTKKNVLIEDCVVIGISFIIYQSYPNTFLLAFMKIKNSVDIHSAFCYKKVKATICCSKLRILTRIVILKHLFELIFESFCFLNILNIIKVLLVKCLIEQISTVLALPTRYLITISSFDQKTLFGKNKVPAAPCVQCAAQFFN